MKKKIILDFVLIILCCTIFSKNSISLAYHEIVGLTLGVLFLVHIVFNRKWIPAAIKKLSDKNYSAKNKVLLVIDILLIMFWIAVIVTGVLVSKKVFAFSLNYLNPYHFFFAAVSLILTGIHIGFHFDYLHNYIKKAIRLNDKQYNILNVFLSIVIVVMAIYFLKNSSFMNWLQAPFRVAELRAMHGGGAGNIGTAGGRPPQVFSVAKLISNILMTFSICGVTSVITNLVLKLKK